MGHAHDRVVVHDLVPGDVRYATDERYYPDATRSRVVVHDVVPGDVRYATDERYYSDASRSRVVVHEPYERRMSPVRTTHTVTSPRRAPVGTTQIVTADARYPAERYTHATTEADCYRADPRYGTDSQYT